LTLSIFDLVGCLAGCPACAAHQLASSESSARRRTERGRITSEIEITQTS